tara:strand:+ start:786 stop:995 length:210 start_codon:yes stop_codon:yes gene_type:complete
MKLNKLIEAHKDLRDKTRELEKEIHSRVCAQASDGRTLSQIQEETGYSFRHIGFILGRKKYEQMVLEQA